MGCAMVAMVDAGSCAVLNRCCFFLFSLLIFTFGDTGWPVCVYSLRFCDIFTPGLVTSVALPAPPLTFLSLVKVFFFFFLVTRKFASRFFC